ncbi:MAG: hypothetical protein J1F32_01760 [Erysipelotrichales bacterium]|nr:hypothetical protein [Erysipelotrichales bacterium]
MKKTNWNNFRKNYRLLAHKGGTPFIQDVIFDENKFFKKQRDLFDIVKMDLDNSV